MGQKILIMGESGTGKSTSMRNLDPAITAIVNPVGKALPFRGKFSTLNNTVESRSIKSWIKGQVAEGKKIIVIDDFQYTLSVPYMNRIKENGWDKWNDFGANYYEIIDYCHELPDDVTVYFLTHTETLENGTTTIKLIGKLLREKITIEGLFTIVLRTSVNEGKYYFLTQNSGNDTVKSPLGMFPSYAIENDLSYVDDKIRSYYELNGAKTDAEMEKADKAAAADLEKPERRTRRTKTHDEVVAENDAKVDRYVEDTRAAVEAIADGRTEIPFDEAMAAMETVPEPELEKVPRRTRKERTEAEDTSKTETPAEQPRRTRRVRTTKED